MDVATEAAVLEIFLVVGLVLAILDEVVEVVVEDEEDQVAPGIVVEDLAGEMAVGGTAVVVLMAEEDNC